jgi:hypothetical protein
MNLSRSRRLQLASSLLFSVVALVMTGCAGEPFTVLDDVPGNQGGDMTAPVVGGGAAAAGSGGSGGVVTAGSPQGGTTSVIVAAAAGADASAGGDDSAGVVGGGMASAIFELIDDVEGSFPKLPAVDGRNGGWFTVHDASNGQVTGASAMPLQPARGSSHFAAGISGAGFTDWGAQLGVSLKSPASGYDASKHCGLRFLAKGSGSGWTLLVSDRLSVPQGGVCVEGSWDAEQGCFHYVGRLSASRRSGAR